MYHDLKNCNIVFFGSGDFPVPTFKHLIGCGCKITGLVTSHDSVTFNDKRLYDIAEQYGIPTYIPDNLKDEKFLKWLWDRQADLFCVISYKILPPEVLRIPVITSFNVHASLLPFLKGPAPIYWAIRNGFKTTGLTSFIMTKKVDSGDIILNKKVDIDVNEETYGSLHEKLSEACCDFTINTIRKIISIPNLSDCAISQPLYDKVSIKYYEKEIFEAPKITSKDKSCISLNLYEMNMNPFRYSKEDYILGSNTYHVRIEELYRQIRSLSPNIGVNCCFNLLKKDSTKEIITIPFKIYEAEIINGNNKFYNYTTNIKYGGVETDGKNYLNLLSGYEPHRVLSVKTIQLEGKKKMNIKDFLNGFKYFKDKEMKYFISVSGCKV